MSRRKPPVDPALFARVTEARTWSSPEHVSERQPPREERVPKRGSVWRRNGSEGRRVMVLNVGAWVDGFTVTYRFVSADSVGNFGRSRSNGRMTKDRTNATGTSLSNFYVRHTPTKDQETLENLERKAAASASATDAVREAIEASGDELVTDDDP